MKIKTMPKKTNRKGITLSLTAAELADMINVSVDTAEHILQGKGELTREEAIHISEVTGHSRNVVSKFFKTVC